MILLLYPYCVLIYELKSEALHMLVAQAVHHYSSLGFAVIVILRGNYRELSTFLTAIVCTEQFNGQSLCG